MENKLLAKSNIVQPEQRNWNTHWNFKDSKESTC